MSYVLSCQTLCVSWCKMVNLFASWLYAQNQTQTVAIDIWLSPPTDLVQIRLGRVWELPMTLG